MSPGRTVVLLFACLALYLFASGVRVGRYGGPSALIGFGCVNTETGPCYADRNLTILPRDAVVFRSGGYDGQFFYYLAAELYHRNGVKITLDEAKIRRSRIGYPLIAGPAYLAGGAEALVGSMSFVLLFAHLLAVFVLCRVPFVRDVPGGALAVLLFAFNPFSLQSYLWNVADGLGISLAVFATAAYARAFVRESQDSRFLAMIAGIVLLALALLTKETMLAIAAGLLAPMLFVDPPERRFLRALGRLGFVAVPLAVLAAYWSSIGYHPGVAAQRGGAPFVGLLGYFQGDPDALFSGRSFLVMLLGWYIVTGLFLGFACLQPLARRWFTGAPLRIGDAALTWRLFGCAVLLLDAGLISFATADEYWGTYGNIMRMFTPGMFAFVMLSACELPERMRKIFTYPVAFVFVVFLVWMLRRELFGALSPVYVLP